VGFVPGDKVLDWSFQVNETQGAVRSGNDFRRLNRLEQITRYADMLAAVGTEPRLRMMQLFVIRPSRRACTGARKSKKGRRRERLPAFVPLTSPDSSWSNSPALSPQRFCFDG